MWHDEDGPSNREAAKAHAKKVLGDPKHEIKKGGPRDVKIADADIDDPKHQQKEG